MNYNCLFCDNKCLAIETNVYYIYNCKNCNIWVWPDNKTFPASKLEFIIDNQDLSRYILTIDYLLNYTFIGYVRPPFSGQELDDAWAWQIYDEMPKSGLILKINEAVQGINPNNVSEKIKTLLTFS